uniref:RNA polymerase sigma factor SigS n=1 Tax=Solibacter usitatus (strain Ellin6076) TaxID=234267 RepID=Q01PL2_SOLUE
MATNETELECEVAALYTAHARELHRFAALTLHQQDGASDAVQEAFLRYFAERKCGGTIENPRAWLYRVLHNYLLDRQARASVKREVAAEEMVEPLDEANNPEARVARSQAARQIAEDLTGREFECLLLRAEGLSYEEMATALGIRSGTVGALLARVRRKLLDVKGDHGAVRMGIAEALGSLLHEGGSYPS